MPVLFGIAAALLATGCASAPDAITPWTNGTAYTPMGPATGAGAFSATINGSTSKAAPYTIRVHITKGGKILPHTHPDDRLITVVAGNLCYGFGDTFSEQGCTMYPEGSHFVVPGNLPHYGSGREEAIYQESGVGPSAFVLPKAGQ
jgi:quercetin dioxygenase-like cupin family protein